MALCALRSPQNQSIERVLTQSKTHKSDVTFAEGGLQIALQIHLFPYLSIQDCKAMSINKTWLKLTKQACKAHKIDLTAKKIISHDEVSEEQEKERVEMFSKVVDYFSHISDGKRLFSYDENDFDQIFPDVLIKSYFKGVEITEQFNRIEKLKEWIDLLEPERLDKENIVYHLILKLISIGSLDVAIMVLNRICFDYYYEADREKYPFAWRNIEWDSIILTLVKVNYDPDKISFYIEKLKGMGIEWQYAKIEFLINELQSKYDRTCDPELKETLQKLVIKKNAFENKLFSWRKEEYSRLSQLLGQRPKLESNLSREIQCPFSDPVDEYGVPKSLNDWNQSLDVRDEAGRMLSVMRSSEKQPIVKECPKKIFGTLEEMQADFEAFKKDELEAIQCHGSRKQVPVDIDDEDFYMFPDSDVDGDMTDGDEEEISSD